MYDYLQFCYIDKCKLYMKKSYNSPYIFIDEAYVTQNTHLDDSDYGRALDSIVIACVDVAIISGDKILLGKRKYHPQKDWWLVGGRIYAGEKPHITAQRHIFDTLGIHIDNIEERLEYLLSFYGIWSQRRHKPKKNGTHTHSSVYMLEVTNEEKNNIHINSEFSDIKWLPFSIVNQSGYHELIKTISSKINNNT